MNRGSNPERALPLLEKALSTESFQSTAWEWAKGHSYVLLRRYEDMLVHILPVVKANPKFVPARVQLARGYAEMGRMADAEATVNTILEIAPKYRLASAARMFPYPKLEDRERLLGALRDAGLPD